MNYAQEAYEVYRTRETLKRGKKALVYVPSKASAVVHSRYWDLPFEIYRWPGCKGKPLKMTWIHLDEVKKK